MVRYVKLCYVKNVFKYGNIRDEHLTKHLTGLGPREPWHGPARSSPARPGRELGGMLVQSREQWCFRAYCCPIRGEQLAQFSCSCSSLVQLFMLKPCRFKLRSLRAHHGCDIFLGAFDCPTTRRSYRAWCGIFLGGLGCPTKRRSCRAWRCNLGGER